MASDVPFLKEVARSKNASLLSHADAKPEKKRKKKRGFFAINELNEQYN